MKKIYLLAVMAAMSATAFSQGGVTLDTYAGAQLATEDLNGTARYVGMGGAMEALGADISTIGTNPAGLGLFRKSQVSGSFGLVTQEDAKSFQDGSKTNLSFDQIGVVLSSRTGRQSYLNVGFNFHKSRNFNQVLSAADRTVNGSSQNRQTTIKGIRGDLDTYWGESQNDQLYYKMIEGADGSLYTVDASSYHFDRAHTGYIGEYDFNLSGNINNQVYLGLTVGIKDIHYNAFSEYTEQLAALDPSLTTVTMTDDHRITGTGYDIKAGIILRPIEESPFRIGAYVSTPTWYKLTTRNDTRISDQYGTVGTISDDQEFRYNTPWKFGLSAGHTIGSNIALGLTYEFADYSTIDMRTIDGSYYDAWYDYYSESSSSDRIMKRHTENTLKSVSTLKLGAEFKPEPYLAVRLGYNYVSPMYEERGQRDQTLDSPGVYMASTTDFTNWKSTHRLTAGVGYTFDRVRLDLAYQYSLRSGDFYPFMDGLSATYIDDAGQRLQLVNECDPVSVRDNRHQLLCSVTYSF